ncbi:MAG: endonuclease/exonuclease/phosphatase family protein [Roseibacillus sp.]
MSYWLIFLLFFAFPLGGSELRVATFNVRYDAKGDRDERDWRARRELVSEAISLMYPDVLGLQEVLHGQLEDLRKAHPEFVILGVARDDGREKGEYSPLLFRKDRFGLDNAESGTFWLSGKPEEPGSVTWGNACTRVCSWARLVEKKTGRGIYVFNTHWDHKGALSRERSAQLILGRIAKRIHPKEAVILMGDFNASELSPEIQLVVTDKKVDLRNSFLVVNPNEPVKGTFNGWDLERVKGAMIDHVFVNLNLKVKSAAIIRHHREGVVPSDHFPVLTVCEW